MRVARVSALGSFRAQSAAQTFERSVLECLGGSDGSAGDLSDTVDREIGDESKDNNFALVEGQPFERLQQLVVEGFVWRRHIPYRWQWGRTSATTPVRVHCAVVRDGEHPPSQRRFVAAKASDVAHDLEEDLAERVLGVGYAEAPQIAKDRCAKLVIRPRGARPISSHRSRASPLGRH
jgi:hypothetical protein